MDQKKTGQFLKTLRKEKNITQENLAETLNVSTRTISRWETGRNMPDISLLVELSEFYQVSIAEIIDGERKSEDMGQETKSTAVKMAEYSKNELSRERQKAVSVILMVFGVFIMISAFAAVPNSPFPSPHRQIKKGPAADYLSAADPTRSFPPTT